MRTRALRVVAAVLVSCAGVHAQAQPKQAVVETSLGTFIIGLPEESEASLARTLELALELEMDFMSLNMAVPRFGTPFRREAVALGLCDEHELVMDQGGAEAFLPTRTLDRPAMLALKRRMIRRFYLRPTYLWRRMTSAKSLYELGAQAREGLALLCRNV